jgi:hypothetical protein
MKLSLIAITIATAARGQLRSTGRHHLYDNRALNIWAAGPTTNAKATPSPWYAMWDTTTTDSNADPSLWNGSSGFGVLADTPELSQGRPADLATASSSSSERHPMCRKAWGFFEQRQCKTKGADKGKCLAKRQRRCQRCCGCNGFPTPDKSTNNFNARLFSPQGASCTKCCSS